MPNETGLVLRIAEMQDAPTLLALIESAYRGDSSRQGWTTEADLLKGQRTDEHGVRAAIISDSGKSLMIVAESAGQIVGCCQLEVKANGHCYFGMFAVRPELQGNGTGRAIVGEAERQARKQFGSNELRLQAFRQRTDLLGWYERLGFADTGDTEAFPYGNESFGIPQRDDLEFVVMSKKLLS